MIVRNALRRRCFLNIEVCQRFVANARGRAFNGGERVRQTYGHPHSLKVVDVLPFKGVLSLFVLACSP